MGNPMHEQVSSVLRQFFSDSVPITIIDVSGRRDYNRFGPDYKDAIGWKLQQMQGGDQRRFLFESDEPAIMREGADLEPRNETQYHSENRGESSWRKCIRKVKPSWLGSRAFYISIACIGVAIVSHYVHKEGVRGATEAITKHIEEDKIATELKIAEKLR